MIGNPHDKRSNLLDMTKNFKSFLAPEEVYPIELREDMLIELFLKSQARSGGAQYNFETMSLLWSNGSKANFRFVDDIFISNFAPAGQYVNRTKYIRKSRALRRCAIGSLVSFFSTTLIQICNRVHLSTDFKFHTSNSSPSPIPDMPHSFYQSKK